MSIASEITRLQNAKDDLKTSINAKTDSSHQITTETIDDYASFVDSIQTGGGGQQYRLPDEYQEVEYIQSSGTQYINTGYNPHLAKIGFNAKFKDGTTTGVMFGVYNSNWGQGIGYYHNTPSNQKDWVHYYYNNETNIVGSTTGSYVINWDKGNATVNGISVLSKATINVQMTRNLYLFAGNWGDTKVEQPISIKLYYFKILENGEIVKDYVPCYRKADGVIGLYDTVEDEFITNAGTGTFEKGADHDTPLINLQDKTVTITTNTTTEITADVGYDGLGKVTIITNV